MTENDKRDADALDGLAKSAIDRFKTRLDWEWKARLGLWTALGAATAFVFGSETWRPTEFDFWVIFWGMSFLLVVYGLCFALAVHVLHAEDIELWRASEERITALAWGGAANVPDNAKTTTPHWLWSIFLSVGQFLVTLLFAAALVYAVHIRETRPDADKQTKSKVTIQQDVPSKVVVNPMKK